MEKVDPKLLLGLSKLPENKEKGEDMYSCVTIVDGTDEHGYKLAQPAVANTETLRTSAGVDMVFPFPQKEGYWPRDKTTISNHCVRRVDRPAPFDNYKTHSMRIFVDKSVNMLITEAKTRGVASFFMTQKAAIEFLDKIHWLTSKFRYHTVYTQNTRNPFDVICTENEVILPIITVFDISLCIPVLNKKRCDGIGLTYEIVLPKSTKHTGRLASAGCLVMLFSNFRDNLFYLDGVNILKERPINHDITKKFKQRTSVEINRKRKKAKKKVERGEAYVECTCTSSGFYTTKF